MAISSGGRDRPYNHVQLPHPKRVISPSSPKTCNNLPCPKVRTVQECFTVLPSEGGNVVFSCTHAEAVRSYGSVDSAVSA